MAGYGNRTAANTTPSDLSDQHNTTRLGLIDSNTAYHNPHEKHGSGITGGAGFGKYPSPLPFPSPFPPPSHPPSPPILQPSNQAIK